MGYRIKNRNLTSKNVNDFIYGYPTRHKQGFIGKEINNILEKCKINKSEIDKDKFYDGLGVNTCMVIGNDFITYHCDVIKGLLCVIEDREQTLGEWD